MSWGLQATSERQITVASYNIHSGIGRDGRYDPLRIRQVLDEIDADVYGLQEVDARPRHPDMVDQFEYFAAQTGMHAIAGPNLIEEGARYGNILLSRWRVAEHHLIDLSIEGYEPRGAIFAVLSCSDRSVQIVTTHLGVRYRERKEQLTRLHDAVSGTALPTIFLGDYNMWGHQQRALCRLGARSNRAAAPKTYPSWFPLVALDRIWANAGARLQGIAAHKSLIARTASDHLPLTAAIRFED